MEPFGRPLISALSSAIVRGCPRKRIQCSEFMLEAIRIWIGILERNVGVTYGFLLSQLPWARDEWFVDASTSWGLGGCYGRRYFALKKGHLGDFFQFIC